MKVTVSYDVKPCSLIDTYQSLKLSNFTANMEPGKYFRDFGK
jgi:hypothetical protein